MTRLALRWAVLWVLGALAFAPNVVFAEGPDTARGSLGLQEALTLASRRAWAVAAAVARRHAALARRDEVSMAHLPDVLIGAGFTDGFPGSGSNLGLRGMLASPFFRHYAAGVDASWDLVDLLRRPHAVQAAEADVDAADASRRASEREVFLVVVDLFERILIATETRAVLEVEIAARREQMGALQARVAGGMVAREQQMQAEAGLFDIEAELATETAEERSARTALRAIIDDDRALSATVHMQTLVADKELPELRMARAWRRQADELSTLRGMEWIPRVTLGASAGYANPPPGVDPGYYAVGLGLSLPLTRALRERSRRGADMALAKARAFEADAVIDQMLIRGAEIDGAIAGLSAALPAAERSREAAEQALEAVAARAQAGSVPQVDVEAARAVVQRTTMRNRMLQIRLDGLRARRTLLTAGPS